MIKTKKDKADRIVQGDIIRNIEYVESVVEVSGQLEISKVNFPLVVVLTQDCDLEQDYRFRWSEEAESKSEDKWLLSVLVAPLYNVEHIYAGIHLSELDMKMQKIPKGKTAGTFLQQNQNPRYHYLKFGSDVPIVDSVVDFKHYFSVNLNYLRQKKQDDFVCQLSELYREDVLQRYASFLSRIGLPE